MVFKQDISIPTGIDLVPFWANLFLFLFFFESTYIKQIISNGPSKPYYGVSRFIDDLCVINDGCKFAASFKNICHKELELKIKHQGIYASFLDFDIKIKEVIFLEKLFDKRDKVPFFIV